MSAAVRSDTNQSIFGVIPPRPYTSGMGRMLATLGVGLVLLTASPGWAGPTDQLREYTDQVVKVLDDPSMARQDRRAAVRKIAHEAFDVTEAAQRVLARHWQARTPAEREEFTQLFADLLERTYIARMDEYGGERIRYVGESIDGNFASVRARIVTRTGTEVAVESRMNLRGDRWLIYDILIENVSLVANYRSQFDRIVRSSSYEELVRRLKTKRDEFLNESAPRARRSSG
jgi:phospholipid transport system substrate-binding protein